MKIGIEALKIFRKHKHGIDIVALEIIRNLQIQDKVNEYVIFVLNDIDDSVLYETENFQIVRLPSLPSPIVEQFILPYLCLKHKIDVLHSTGNTAPLINFCTRIITLHDVIFLENSNIKGGSLYQNLGNAYRKFVVPKIIKRCKRIITVSESEKKSILKVFPELESKVEVIHNAAGPHFKIKPIETTNNVSTRYKLPADGFIFLHGNSDPKKNLNNVLCALNQLRLEGKLNCKIVISDLPKWRLNSRINKLGLHGLEKKIILTNYITNTDLPDVYNLAKLFLYISKRESFGLPILEALSCGTTTITSNTSAMPEVGGKAVLYCDPDNIKSIVTEINNALNEDLYCSTVELYREAQIKKFSWKKSTELLINIYSVSKVNKLSPSSISY